MNKRIIGCILIAIAIVSGCSKKEAASTAAKQPPKKVAKPRIRPLTNRDDWTVTASSTEEGFAPEKGADGSFETRWSSEWKDNQWWMIDFGKAELLNNLVLHWEDAYARSYDVLLSKDGKQWDKVFSEEDGNGTTDNIAFEKQEARYVKINCRQRATKWGFSLIEVEVNKKAKIKMEASASSGSGDFKPVNAVDGDGETRWSSNFGDEEWWMVKFDAPQMLCGVRIVWETAFGEKYKVQLSIDGKEWETVYDVLEGDGQTDLLFFSPTKALYLKIQGVQRGTGWGYSIWDVEFFTDDERPILTASSGENASLALDGNPKTGWETSEDGKQQFDVELKQPLELGGIQLLWGEDFAKAYDIDVSTDGEKWSTIYKTEMGNGEKDYAFFPATEVGHIRVRCAQSSRGQGYDLNEIEFKSGEEQATPIQEYKAAAKDAPRGWYPQWLKREQEFWTVTGVIDDQGESLLGETGCFEPTKGGYSVTPFILSDDGMTTWADVKLHQFLDRTILPLPTVQWKPEAWELDISAFAFGPLDKSSTAVRYHFVNNGSEPFKGQLALAIRPVQLNPVWQRGGMSPIYSARCDRATSPAMVYVNGRRSIVSPEQPAVMCALPLEDGDVANFISRGSLAEKDSATDAQGRVGVGLVYDLEVAPGEAQDIVLVYPLHGASEVPQELVQQPAEGFKNLWKKQADMWWNVLNQFQISIPDQRLIDVMKSNLAYILINKDGPWIKPGSRNYGHAWIRDGAMTSVTLLRMGLYPPVKWYIEAYTPLVTDFGWAPFIIMEDGNPAGFNEDEDSGEGQEYDSQGQYVFLVRQYVDFTGDTKLLEEVWPTVLKTLEFGKQLRRRRMTPEYKNDPEKRRFYGILPESNSHEGYFPAKHSYWDDFWMLRGYKDGAYLADMLGKTTEAAMLREEEQALRSDMLDSMALVMREEGINHIPGCAELGDFDATSTAIAIMACEETETLPEQPLKNTFDGYYNDVSKGMEPGHERTFTPYEVRSADAFVRMGQRERALKMLRYFTRDSVRPYNWNHFAEVVHARPRAPSYIGDMPHTWVGSGYINAVRSIFAYEDHGRIIMAAGIDPKWATSHEGVTVKDLPTQYGNLTYLVRAGKQGAVKFDLAGGANPPNGFVIPLPKEWLNRHVEVQTAGDPVVLEGEILFDKGPATIIIYPEGYTPPAKEEAPQKQDAGAKNMSPAQAADAPAEEPVEAAEPVLASPGNAEQE